MNGNACVRENSSGVVKLGEEVWYSVKKRGREGASTLDCMVGSFDTIIMKSLSQSWLLEESQFTQEYACYSILITVSQRLGVVHEKHGLWTNIMMDFMHKSRRSWVNYIPCNWRSVRYILMATIDRPIVVNRRVNS